MSGAMQEPPESRPPARPPSPFEEEVAKDLIRSVRLSDDISLAILPCGSSVMTELMLSTFGIHSTESAGSLAYHCWRTNNQYRTSSFLFRTLFDDEYHACQFYIHARALNGMLKAGRPEDRGTLGAVIESYRTTEDQFRQLALASALSGLTLPPVQSAAAEILAMPTIKATDRRLALMTLQVIGAARDEYSCGFPPAIAAILNGAARRHDEVGETAAKMLAATHTIPIDEIMLSCILDPAQIAAYRLGEGVLRAPVSVEQRRESCLPFARLLLESFGSEALEAGLLLVETWTGEHRLPPRQAENVLAVATDAKEPWTLRALYSFALRGTPLPPSFFETIVNANPVEALVASMAYFNRPSAREGLTELLFRPALPLQTRCIAAYLCGSLQSESLYNDLMKFAAKRDQDREALCLAFCRGSSDRLPHGNLIDLTENHRWRW